MLMLVVHHAIKHDCNEDSFAIVRCNSAEASIDILQRSLVVDGRRLLVRRFGRFCTPAVPFWGGTPSFKTNVDSTFLQGKNCNMSLSA